MVKKTQTATAEISVPVINTQRGTLLIQGTTGLYYNRMSEKVKRELLIGGKRKTAAEKAVMLKHNPVVEYRDSLYRDDDFNSETCLFLPAVVVKNAMTTAAMITPGVTGADIRRLVSVVQDRIPIYGMPCLRMDVVKQAGIQGAPDIRTRAYLPRWGAEVEIEWISPNLTKESITALIHNAGLVSGLGDFRQEKGKGNFGKYEIVSKLTVESDKAAQFAELSADMPTLFDSETENLMRMFEESVPQEKRQAAGLHAVS